MPKSFVGSGFVQDGRWENKRHLASHSLVLPNVQHVAIADSTDPDVYQLIVVERLTCIYVLVVDVRNDTKSEVPPHESEVEALLMRHIRTSLVTTSAWQKKSRYPMQWLVFVIHEWCTSCFSLHLHLLMLSFCLQHAKLVYSLAPSIFDFPISTTGLLEFYDTTCHSMFGNSQIYLSVVLHDTKMVI